MFAVVARVELPEGETIEQGRETLDTIVIPGLKQAQGFVSAMFLSAQEGREGLGIVVFNTKEDANTAKENFRTPPGVTPISIEVHEVARAT
jgi:hypothetical protein